MGVVAGIENAYATQYTILHKYFKFSRFSVHTTKKTQLLPSDDMTNTKALFIGIFANCIWGFAFIIPYMAREIDPILITIGRYISYGLLSASLIPFLPKGHLGKLTVDDWKVVLILSFTGNIGYYALVVAAIHMAGVPVAALIIGTLPVTIAMIGNIVEREFDFRRLLPAVAMILMGLCLLNGSKLLGATNPADTSQLIAGIVLAASALLLWTIYGITNAHYMKRNPAISANLWSVAIGIATGVQAVIAILILVPLQSMTTFVNFSSLNDQSVLIKFLIGSLVLGTIVSWYATVLWNSVSRSLPVAVAGQLVVFETLSSLLYTYIVDKRFPDAIEISSSIVIVTGVVIGIRSTITAGSELKPKE